jgi:chromosome segregation ATPase
MELRKILLTITLMCLPCGLFAVTTGVGATQFLKKLSKYANKGGAKIILAKGPFRELPRRDADFSALDYNQKVGWFLNELKIRVEAWRESTGEQKNIIGGRIANFVNSGGAREVYRLIGNEGEVIRRRFGTELLGLLVGIIGIDPLRVQVIRTERLEKKRIREPEEKEEIKIAIPKKKKIILFEKTKVTKLRDLEDRLNKLIDPKTGDKEQKKIIEFLKEYLKGHEQEMAKTKLIVEDFRKNIAELEEEIKNRNEKIIQSTKLITKMQKKIEEIKMEQEKEKPLFVRKEQIIKLQKELKELTQARADDLDRHTKSRESYERIMLKIKSEDEKLKKENEQLKKENEQLTTAKRNLTSRIEQLKKTKVELRGNLKEWTALGKLEAIKEKVKTADELRKTVGDLKDTVDELMKKQGELQKKERVLTARLLKANNDNSQLKFQKTQSEQKIREQKKEIESLKGIVSNIGKQSNVLGLEALRRLISESLRKSKKQKEKKFKVVEVEL